MRARWARCSGLQTLSVPTGVARSDWWLVATGSETKPAPDTRRRFGRVWAVDPRPGTRKRAGSTVRRKDGGRPVTEASGEGVVTKSWGFTASFPPELLPSPRRRLGDTGAARGHIFPDGHQTFLSLRPFRKRRPPMSPASSVLRSVLTAAFSSRLGRRGTCRLQHLQRRGGQRTLGRQEASR